MKRLIIYDLDGTLVDTRKDIAAAANHMRGEMGKPPLRPREIEKFVGKGLHHLVKNCLGTEKTKEIEKGAKIYRAYYAEHMLDHSRLYPGVREVLEHFRSRKQAVITNKPNPFSRDLLSALGVGGYFEAIIAGDSEFPKKPHPAAVISVMKNLDIGPAGTLFVGDSGVDMQTGRNAGVTTVAVAHGFEGEDELKLSHPDAVVGDFKELLRLVKEKQW